MAYDLIVQVRHSSVESPFGELLVAVTDRGVVRVAFPEENEDAVLGELSDELSADVSAGSLDHERQEFEDYFEGRLRDFDVPVDLGLAPGFARRVLEATSRIPYGSVSTYGQIAGKAGSRRAARAAGNALRGNPVPIIVPCHRVIRSGGGLGGYAGREDRKAFLLSLEGTRA